LQAETVEANLRDSHREVADLQSRLAAAQNCSK
jgi:hypothetical protein